MGKSLLKTNSFLMRYNSSKTTRHSRIDFIRNSVYSFHQFLRAAKKLKGLENFDGIRQTSAPPWMMCGTVLCTLSRYGQKEKRSIKTKIATSVQFSFSLKHLTCSFVQFFSAFRLSLIVMAISIALRVDFQKPAFDPTSGCFLLKFY